MADWSEIHVTSHAVRRLQERYTAFAASDRTHCVYVLQALVRGAVFLAPCGEHRRFAVNSWRNSGCIYLVCAVVNRKCTVITVYTQAMAVEMMSSVRTMRQKEINDKYNHQVRQGAGRRSRRRSARHRRQRDVPETDV